MPELNGAGMSDISFLLLSFFLMTSSMDQTSGLQRRLPPMPPDEPIKQSDENKVKVRNVFQVKINQWDALFAGGKPMDLNMLRAEVKDFILNPTDDPNKPEKKEQNIPGLGPLKVSEAVISLQNDRGTSYEAYIKVQNELVAAYNELREEFSRAQYGKSFDDLIEEDKDAVREVYPQRISEAEPKDVSKTNTRRR